MRARRGIVPFTTVLGVLGVALIVMVAAYVLTRSAGNAVPVAGQSRVAAGDASNGPALLRDYGCVTCHLVPGVREANGAVGPELTRFARRALIAGHLENTPENLVFWIRFPQLVEPGTAMPDLGVSEQHARDIAAYLYTLE